MDEKFTYSDCESKYIDQGYDEGLAKEICESEGRSSDEDPGTSREEESDYWGEV